MQSCVREEILLMLSRGPPRLIDLNIKAALCSDRRNPSFRTRGLRLPQQFAGLWGGHSWRAVVVQHLVFSFCLSAMQRMGFSETQAHTHEIEIPKSLHIYTLSVQAMSYWNLSAISWYLKKPALVYPFHGSGLLPKFVCYLLILKRTRPLGGPCDEAQGQQNKHAEKAHTHCELCAIFWKLCFTSWVSPVLSFLALDSLVSAMTGLLLEQSVQHVRNEKNGHKSTKKAIQSRGHEWGNI